MYQWCLSLPRFIELYGTEEKCEPALEQARWPDGFRCPRCECKEHGLIHGRRHKRYQCGSCRHQATLTAGTILEATKLPLTTWFLPLRQERSPLGLTHPPGGQTDDHETDL
jgi:hypothetical protein